MDDPSFLMSAGSADPSSSDCPTKSCAVCRTTRTPLWRAGPSGPKSLCNACGIRYRKNRRVAAPGSKKEKIEVGAPLKLRMLGLWEHRSTIQKQSRRMGWRRSMLGEEEEAAVLLMALSSGLLYA
ncbi:GATA transcription factor 16-like [Musa acuminata AAA Group]|uniref:GATA-type domain-containing protein n=2 Tax=Musa TaxID=4640 RepID=A0A4S8J6M7_MUSBA|nr:PREDICTED: GATA transcription factor 16 [Musa acuminata subsp. malaccensis]THU57161.1 hypothetical protein C4D60_Mb03t00600 [Musa balbisiana]CAG1848770.1 unnamed protein product [Musa acuminata subsp. malaccensis]